MSAGGGQVVESIDSKLARAGRLFLSAHDSDQIDGDILLSEARETVAALVEALTRLRREWKYQCDIGNVPDGRIEVDLADAALKAAGVEL